MHANFLNKPLFGVCQQTIFTLTRRIKLSIPKVSAPSWKPFSRVCLLRCTVWKWGLAKNQAFPTVLSTRWPPHAIGYPFVSGSTCLTFVFVITGHQFFLVPPFVCAKIIWSLPWHAQENSGFPLCLRKQVPVISYPYRCLSVSQTSAANNTHISSLQFLPAGQYELCLSVIRFRSTPSMFPHRQATFYGVRSGSP